MVVSWILYKVNDFDKLVGEAEEEEPMLIMRMETGGLGHPSTAVIFYLLHLCYSLVFYVSTVFTSFSLHSSSSNSSCALHFL